MLVIERRVGRVLRYRKVYFPTPEEALRSASSMRRNDITRLLGVYDDPGALPRIVSCKEMLTTLVDLSAGPQAILRGMKRKSCRYEIHRAEKMLDRTRIEVNSPKALADFLPLYSSFAEAKGPVPRLSSRRFREYSDHGEVFVVYLDGRALCGHLLVCDAGAGVAKLLYSASRRLDAPDDAAACGALNRYLHWHEMQRYCARGFATYDFGGIRYPEHPTARFKLSFGGRVVTERIYLLARAKRLARLGSALGERLLGRRTISPGFGAPEAAPDGIPSTD